jgi:hypothetical protein
MTITRPPLLYCQIRRALLLSSDTPPAHRKQALDSYRSISLSVLELTHETQAFPLPELPQLRERPLLWVVRQEGAGNPRPFSGRVGDLRASLPLIIFLTFIKEELPREPFSCGLACPWALAHSRAGPQPTWKPVSSCA